MGNPAQVDSLGPMYSHPGNVQDVVQPTPGLIICTGVVGWKEEMNLGMRLIKWLPLLHLRGMVVLSFENCC